MENQNLYFAQQRPSNRGNQRQTEQKPTLTPQSAKQKAGLPPKGSGNALVDKLMQNIKPGQSVIYQSQNIDDLVSNSGQSATTQDRRNTDMETASQNSKQFSLYGRQAAQQQQLDSPQSHAQILNNPKMKRVEQRLSSKDPPDFNQQSSQVYSMEEQMNMNLLNQYKKMFQSPGQVTSSQGQHLFKHSGQLASPSRTSIPSMISSQKPQSAAQPKPKLPPRSGNTRTITTQRANKFEQQTVILEEESPLKDGSHQKPIDSDREVLYRKNGRVISQKRASGYQVDLKSTQKKPIRDTSNQSSSKSRKQTSLKNRSNSRRDSDKTSNSNKSLLIQSTKKRAQAYGINLQHQRMNSVADATRNKGIIKSQHELTLENNHGKLRGRSQNTNRIKTSKPAVYAETMTNFQPSNQRDNLVNQTGIVTPFQITPSGALHNTSQGFFERRHIPHRAQPRLGTAHSNTSLAVSDHQTFKNHGLEIKRMRQDWEGKPDTDEFWNNRNDSQDKRKIMQSTQMKSESQSVLDKQLEIFRKLKAKGEKMESAHVKALETGSDYMLEDVTPLGEIFQPFSPMGEVIFDDSSNSSHRRGPEQQPGTAPYGKKSRQKMQQQKMTQQAQPDKELNPNTFMGMKNQVLDDEPIRPNFNQNDFEQLSDNSFDLIKQLDEEEDDGDDNTYLKLPNANVTNYDDWLAQKVNLNQNAAYHNNDNLRNPSNTNTQIKPPLVGRTGENTTKIQNGREANQSILMKSPIQGSKLGQKTPQTQKLYQRSSPRHGTVGGILETLRSEDNLDNQVARVEYDVSNDNMSHYYNNNFVNNNQSTNLHLPPITSPQLKGQIKNVNRAQTKQELALEAITNREQSKPGDTLLSNRTNEKNNGKLDLIRQNYNQTGAPSQNQKYSTIKTEDLLPYESNKFREENFGGNTERESLKLQNKKTYDSYNQTGIQQNQKYSTNKQNDALPYESIRMRDEFLNVEQPLTSNRGGNSNRGGESERNKSSNYSRPLSYLRANATSQDDRQNSSPNKIRPHQKLQSIDKVDSRNLKQPEMGNINPNLVLMNQTAPEFFNLKPVEQKNNVNTMNPQTTFNQTLTDGLQLKQTLQVSGNRDSIRDLNNLLRTDRTNKTTKLPPDPNRLYKQDTFSSQLKKNPRLAFEQKQKPIPAKKPQQRKKKQSQVSISSEGPLQLEDEECELEQFVGSNMDVLPEEPEEFEPLALIEQDEQENTKEILEPEEPPIEVEEYDISALVLPDETYEKSDLLNEPTHNEVKLFLPNEDYFDMVRGLMLPIEMIELFTGGVIPENEPFFYYPAEEEQVVFIEQERHELSIIQSESSVTLLTVKEAGNAHEDKISSGCQAEFFEENKDDFSEEEEDLYITEIGHRIDLRDCGIQTSKIHFTRIEKTDTFQSSSNEKAFSTDWALSSIYDDLQFVKKNQNQLFPPPTEDCGNQVEEKQIVQETTVQILSQIECEYNAEMLKRKQVTGAATYAERAFELYILGLNTLQALMYVLRLQKEWQTVTRHQYELDFNMDGSIKTTNALNLQVDSDACIKLLTRCNKMYEAKHMIQMLLKMIMNRESLVKELHQGTNQSEQKDILSKVRRLGQRITSQINTLQEEHRILKRPFILRGQEYLSELKIEQDQLEQSFEQKYFVDERGTVGNQSSYL